MITCCCAVAAASVSGNSGAECSTIAGEKIALQAADGKVHGRPELASCFSYLILTLHQSVNGSLARLPVDHHSPDLKWRTRDKAKRVFPFPFFFCRIGKHDWVSYDRSGELVVLWCDDICGTTSHFIVKDPPVIFGSRDLSTNFAMKRKCVCVVLLLTRLQVDCAVMLMLQIPSASPLPFGPITLLPLMKLCQ